MVGTNLHMVGINPIVEATKHVTVDTYGGLYGIVPNIMGYVSTVTCLVASTIGVIPTILKFVPTMMGLFTLLWAL